jgi:monoamine oxidase
VTLAGGHTLLGFRPTGLGERSLELDVRTKSGMATLVAQRLILALPRLPLVKLAHGLPEHMASQLDSVNRFPMLKVFLVSNAPWWDYDQNGRIVDAFALFVARDVKRAVEGHHSEETNVRLTESARKLFQDMTLDQATAWIRNSIITYGLRDWARPPYGAANHGWQPGVRSWKVMDTFKAFDFGSGAKNVHIVGEAYSDYQGFIEGALNSAELALQCVPARVDAEPESEG